MKFSLPALLCLAVAVSAVPTEPHAGEKYKYSKKLTIEKAEGKCGDANVSCCFNVHENQGSGLIGNLLGEGLVHNLVGNTDSACAPFNLLSDINLLALTKKEDHGTVCKNTIACCPNGGECTAIDADDD
ncbi:hypothetical protein BDV59DRAFT_206249 [Aspergillus ambiguus]|uniref:uncharacterized protein n=1 Tax=Aspergillus ambiguus TaxID=176160 RepID=UPI003CCDAFBD